MSSQPPSAGRSSRCATSSRAARRPAGSRRRSRSGPGDVRDRVRADRGVVGKAAGRDAEVGARELGEHPAGVGGGAVAVGQRDDARDRLAEVEPRQPLPLGLVEEKAGRRPTDGVDAEVVRAPARGVVGHPVLHDVVRDGAGRGPEVPVDRGLGVRVDVVEQPEALGERVLVGRVGLAEQRQLRVAVAPGFVAHHLVVAAVLLDDVEDVADLRGARGDRAAGRGLLGVDRTQLARGAR